MLGVYSSSRLTKHLLLNQNMNFRTKMLFIKYLEKIRLAALQPNKHYSWKERLWSNMVRGIIIGILKSNAENAGLLRLRTLSAYNQGYKFDMLVHQHSYIFAVSPTRGYSHALSFIFWKLTSLSESALWYLIFARPIYSVFNCPDKASRA